MKKTRTNLLVFTIVVVNLLISVQTVFAGPGGKIAEAVFRSFWGKIILVTIFVVFGVILIPLAIFFWIREYRAVKQTTNDLKNLAVENPAFDWMSLKEQIANTFHRVHSAWRKEDMQEAENFMTAWYWQNQQMAFLDQWERDGLINHCRVKNIKSIKPLFVCRKGKDSSIENSRLVVLISADIEDYLADRTTGKIVEGKEGYNEVETVWSFLFERGNWVVSNIEERNTWYSYARTPNEITAIAGSEVRVFEQN